MTPERQPTARTLEEVAQAAGVSRMTVSRVLRHPERVAEKTRQKVLDVIGRLSYRPNPLISTLMASTRQRRVSEINAGIAFLVSMERAAMDDYHVARRIYEGAKARAEAKGYEVVLHSLSDERIPEKRLAAVLRARGVEGIIFGPLSSRHAELAIDLSGFASSACGFSLTKPTVHRAATNQWELASQAYLMAEERGYQRIGVAMQSGYLQGISPHWHSAFLYHLERASSEIPMLICEHHERNKFLTWLNQWTPDCVIGSTPEYFDIIQNINPRDAAIPSFLLLGNFANRDQISGWRKNYEGIGASAVDLIALQLIDNERGAPKYRKTVLLDPQWNEGTTLPFHASAREQKRLSTPKKAPPEQA